MLLVISLLMMTTSATYPELVTETGISISLTVYVSSCISCLVSGVALGRYSLKQEAEVSRLTAIVETLSNGKEN